MKPIPTFLNSSQAIGWLQSATVGDYVIIGPYQLKVTKWNWDHIILTRQDGKLLKYEIKVKVSFYSDKDETPMN